MRRHAACALLLAFPSLAQREDDAGRLYAKRFEAYAVKFAEAQDAADPTGPDARIGSALQRAHLYLAGAQRADGSWPAGSASDITPIREVGVTALACLALMEDGHDVANGPYKQVVKAGLDWLVAQQDEDSGLVGQQLGHAFLYDHAIATLALAEATRRDREAGYRPAAQAAVDLALRARNPYGAWRYDVPPVGDNDSSVTGWMVTALARAEDAGLRVGEQAFVGALAWFDEVTDPATGRAGYDSLGSRSSRISGVNDHFPPERGEGMTAVALYCRLLRGQSRHAPIVESHADLLLKQLPVWDPEGLGTDMYYWYFGTRAMHAMGEEHWRAWHTSLVGALLPSQEQDGGWPAVGPWGMIGGRSYATALMASCLALDAGDAAPHESDVADAVEPRAPAEPAAAPDAPLPPGEDLVLPRDAARSRAAVGRALEWLVANQAQDGSWDVREFPSSEGASDIGNPIHEIGVTALALLVLQGDGHDLGEGEHRRAVARGLRWLRDQQDVETGLVGEAIGHSFLYDHAVATAALAEAYRTTRTPLLKATCQRAVNYILRARNPYGAWRYDVPPVGDNDTSVTAWMVIALRTAESAGLKVDEAAYQGAVLWIDEVTDPATGRVGYDSLGSLSSRVMGVNDMFPPERGEAMTGAGLYVRHLLGPWASGGGSGKSVELLLRRQPEWAPGEFGCDLYYWMHGSNAMYAIGGAPRAAWSHSLRATLLPHQRADGELAGSWDPVDPWSFAGGRVYSTSLAALALQSDYRAPVGSRRDEGDEER